VRERVQIALVEHGLELPGRTATDPVIAGTGIGSDEVGLHGARLTNDVSVTPDADALRG
jgi:hypothetical protein